MSQESQDATTTLHIVIGGLCLLVRDEDRADGKRMLHVLMPDDSLMPAGGHAHQAVLMYRPDYGCPNSGKKVCTILMDNVVFDLTTQLGGAGINGSIQLKGVVDEKCIKGRRVERRLLDADKLDPQLKCRITIASGGPGNMTNVGGLWELGPCKQNMATLVHWMIPNLPAGDLSLTYKSKGVDQTLKLTPKAGAIELFFLNEMPMNLPDSAPSLSNLPEAKEPTHEDAVHFAALYPLMRKSNKDKTPKYKGKGGDRRPESKDDKGHVRKEYVGFDFQCIAATAPAEPKA